MEYLNKRKLIEDYKEAFQFKKNLNKKYNLLKNKIIEI